MLMFQAERNVSGSLIGCVAPHLHTRETSAP